MPEITNHFFFIYRSVKMTGENSARVLKLRIESVSAYTKKVRLVETRTKFNLWVRICLLNWLKEILKFQLVHTVILDMSAFEGLFRMSIMIKRDPV